MLSYVDETGGRKRERRRRGGRVPSPEKVAIAYNIVNRGSILGR